MRGLKLTLKIGGGSNFFSIFFQKSFGRPTVNMGE